MIPTLIVLGLLALGMSMGQWLCIPMIVAGVLLADGIRVPAAGHLAGLPHGALRHAADALLADTTDPQRSQADRDISAAALSRLYSFAQEVQV